MSLSKTIGDILYFFDKRRKKVVFANFDLVFPGMSKDEKIKLAKKVYENFAFNLLELIKNRNLSPEDLKKKIEFVGMEKAEKYLNKPAIFITAHYGNWEIIPWVLGGILNIPMTVVVRDLDNKLVNYFVKTSREKYNIKTVNKKGALKKLIGDIKKGRSVGILVDQNTARKEGEDVVMFGLKALHTPSAALLSKRFKIPIIPVFVQRDKDKYKFIFKDPIIEEEDIKKSVQKQSDVIEEMIRQKPEEWFWFHRRFKHYYEDRYE